MTEFTPISGLLGGMLIGISSVILLLGSGRIAGISGIYGGLLKPRQGEVVWRATFFAGLVIGGLLWPLIAGEPLPVNLQVGWPMMLVAGALVGFGTRLGGGCTSGHGVCGIGRLSSRSITATGVFMFTAIATTFVVRHVAGA